MRTRTARLLGTAAATAVTFALVVPAGSASAATPKLDDVTRSGANLTDLTMSWPAVSDTDHYTVSITAGSKQLLKTVAGDQTSATFADVAPACDRIQVQVTAVAADGTKTVSSLNRLPRTGPGAVRGLVATREGNRGSTATLDWSAPTDPGMAPVTDYTVVIRQLSNGRVLVNRQSDNTHESLSGLDGNRQYVAKITANNKYGSCVTSTMLMLNQKPTPPRNVQGWRDPANPAQTHIKWDGALWGGYGALDGYDVYYRAGNSKKYTIKRLGNTTSTVLNLDPARRWSVFVRAINGNDRSKLSKELWILGADEPQPVEEDPKVSATESDGILTMTFVGAVGSSKRFPKINVAIAPTGGGKGIRDDHEIANGAATVVFDRIPCGEYTVVVTGVGNGISKELKRLTLNRCAL